MGRCYMAIVSEGENGQNMIDICTWRVTGYNGFNNEDPWNGLNLRYPINYPLSLLITPGFQEKLVLIFRYFFPIKYFFKNNKYIIIKNNKLQAYTFRSK